MFIAPDGKPASVSYSTTMDIAIIREVFSAVVSAAEVILQIYTGKSSQLSIVIGSNFNMYKNMFWTISFLKNRCWENMRMILFRKFFKLNQDFLQQKLLEMVPLWNGYEGNRIYISWFLVLSILQGRIYSSVV